MCKGNYLHTQKFCFQLISVHYILELANKGNTNCAQNGTIIIYYISTVWINNKTL